ncbi:MAG: AbrB/MazE/SpoVT family DNA-binding domain-containing protein [Betaproteobacteria bacterium]|nr:AbrB/MazE/SpoVT family DNA-binding domain-containing protein [Betaproteobacteria bacterium]
MRVTIKKWGNSASVRIPAPIMLAANLQVDATVDVREESGLVVIEPVVADVGCDLNALIAGITPENLHDEVDFGPAVGGEAF